MLQAQPHRRERVLDLVRHLPRHLAPREHPLRAGDVGDVVERDHDASHLRSQRRELEGDPPPASLELGRRLGGRRRRRKRRTAVVNGAHSAPSRSSSGAPSSSSSADRSTACRLAIRTRPSGSMPTTPVATVAEHGRGAPAGLLERVLAAPDVGGHALERAEDRLELERRVVGVRRHRLPAAERQGGAPELGHRAGERARRALRADQRGRHPRQRREQQHQREVELAHGERGVVGQLRRGQHADVGRSRRAGPPDSRPARPATGSSRRGSPRARRRWRARRTRRGPSAAA